MLKTACFLFVFLSILLPDGSGLEDDLAAVAAYRFGESRAPLQRLEDLILRESGNAEFCTAIAARMAKELSFETATEEGKRFFCRQLGLIGTEREVPALAALLGNRALAGSALAALEHIPGEASIAAMREALSRVEGPIRLALIRSLGDRRDGKSVEHVGRCLKSKDRSVAEAALVALGRIGNDRALSKLLDGKKDLLPDLVDGFFHALFACASSLLDAGNRERAAPLLEGLLDSSCPDCVRGGAFLAVLRLNEEQCEARILEALATGDAVLCRAALGYIRKYGPPDLVNRFAEDLACPKRIPIPRAEYERIEDAAPDSARTVPGKKRRLLVFSRSWGYKHSAIPYGDAAMEVLSRKTGAFEAVITCDHRYFEKESLERFDAVFFNNTNNEIFLPEDFGKLSPDEQERARAVDTRLKKNLDDFLWQGGGLAVTHAGVASFREWPEFGEIIGARFDNHPWNAGSTVALKVDDPAHPVAQAFAESPSLEISDEIYQLKGEYSREKVRVLVSLDMEKTAVTPAQEKRLHRADRDFPVSYVKTYGRGRIFYCALGHQHELFWNPVVLQHYLDGIQFVLGDLEGSTIPSRATAAPRLSWRRTGEGLALLNQGRIVWQLLCDQALGKAYFHPLSLLDGVPLTWLNPPDHEWHRALWFSWKYINGLNYWETSPDMGRTELIDFRDEVMEDFSARMELEIGYHPSGKRAVLKEKRTLIVSPPWADGRYFIDWQGDFTAQEDLELNRTPPPGEPKGESWGGYAGMSVRLAAETGEWRIRDSESRAGMACHRQPARWIACGFTHRLSGRKATIAILDHPRNRRHPPPSFVVQREDIPFVYYSPALLFNEPLALAEGEVLRLRYRILVSPGDVVPDLLNKEWKRFAKGADHAK
jgi:type 1 glutamine amidotransferase/HEAT repeat protein